MKKTIAYIMVATVLTIIGLLGYSIYQGLEEDKVIRERISVLPELDVRYLNSQVELSKTPKPIIISYFNSNCRYCKAEITNMQAHPFLKDEAKIILISDEPPPVLENFVEELSIDTTRFLIAWDQKAKTKELLGVKSVPVNFIYTADSSLTDIKKGEVKAELLYDMIK